MLDRGTFEKKFKEKPLADSRGARERLPHALLDEESGAAEIEADPLRTGPESDLLIAYN